MIIAIIGPDGSGKTTYVKHLQKYFHSKNISSKTAYPFNYFILRKILDRGKNENESGSLSGNKKNKNVLFKFWPIFSLFDNWLDYLVNLRFFKGKVICERYYYDLATSFSEYGYTFDWLYHMYLFLIPKPDICIVLNTNDYKILKQRETDQEHSEDFFKRQTKRYEEISKRFGFDTIDISDDLETCKKEIIDIYEKRSK